MKEFQRDRKTGKEQYYTPSDVAEKCTKIMLEVVGDEAFQRKWLEPAGGTGIFIESLNKFGITDITSFDIEPKHSQVNFTEDFLQENISHLDGCITLTNPPYGRANKCSVPFFNKCAEVSNHIGFLVPKSWKKWSVTNRLDLNFHLVKDIDINVHFIDGDGKLCEGSGITTSFQVWSKSSTKREKVKIPDRGYITKVQPEESDVSLKVYGHGCGNLKKFKHEVPNTMFLKCHRPWVEQALNEVDFSRFSSNTLFLPALSIMEINYLLNEWADKNGHT